MKSEYFSSQYGMKNLVKTFGNSEMKKLYFESSHSAVTDADLLCLISTNERFQKRFLSWIVFDDFGFGESEILDKKPRSRSEVRFRPG